jgi:hypothetical protein
MSIGEDAMKGLALGISGAESMVAGVMGNVAGDLVPSIELGGGRPAGQTTVNVTVTSADPQAVVEAIKRYTRLNGPLSGTVNV